MTPYFRSAVQALAPGAAGGRTGSAEWMLPCAVGWCAGGETRRTVAVDVVYLLRHATVRDDLAQHDRTVVVYVEQLPDPAKQLLGACAGEKANDSVRGFILVDGKNRRKALALMIPHGQLY